MNGDDLPMGEAQWLIPAPGEDETISSVVARACNAYGLRPVNWIERLRAGRRFLMDFEGEASLDEGHTEDLLAIARLLAIHPHVLAGHALPRGEYLLCGECRGTYCPTCWAAADADGRPRAFLRRHQSLFAINCHIHPCTPLLWVDLLSRDEVDVVGLLAMPPSPHARDFLRWLGTFTYQLERCLFHGEAWPTHWFGCAPLARDMIVACMARTGQSQPFRAPRRLMIPYRLERWMYEPRGSWAQIGGDSATVHGWDELRGLTLPAYRRAGFWLLAWITDSTMPVDYWIDRVSVRHLDTALEELRTGGNKERWARFGLLMDALRERERDRALPDDVKKRTPSPYSAWRASSARKTSRASRSTEKPLDT